MLLQQAAGVSLTPVVFRGSAPAITELMAGRIDLFGDQATNTGAFPARRPDQGLCGHAAGAGAGARPADHG